MIRVGAHRSPPRDARVVARATGGIERRAAGDDGGFIFYASARSRPRARCGGDRDRGGGGFGFQAPGGSRRRDASTTTTTARGRAGAGAGARSSRDASASVGRRRRGWGEAEGRTATGCARAPIRDAAGGMTSVPIASRVAPENAQRFMLVEGLGFVVVMSPATCVDSMVAVAQILVEEERSALARAKALVMEQRQRRAMDEAHAQIFVTQAQSAAQAAANVVFAETGRSTWTSAPTQPPIPKTRQKRKSKKEKQKPKTHGPSSSPGTTHSSPNTAPPSPPAFPTAVIATPDSANEEEFPALPIRRTLPPDNVSALVEPVAPPLPPSKWFQSQGSSPDRKPVMRRNKGKRFMRRRIDRVEQSHWELAMFLSSHHEQLEKRSVEAIKGVRECIRLLQRCRVDHDNALDNHDALIQSITESGQAQSPLFQRCACSECASFESDIDGLIGYNFCKQTCDCDACLKMYVRALCKRRCVCPKCFEFYTEMLHASSETSKQLFSEDFQGADDIPSNTWKGISVFYSEN